MSDEGRTDLGHGVIGRFLEDEDGIVGVIHDHPAADGSAGALGGGVCHGFMPLTGRADGPTWDVAAGNPDTTGFDGLTLTPSSLCRLCGHHGFITEGRWVQA